MTAKTSNAMWRLLTRDQRECAYSPSSMIDGDYQPFLAAYADNSRRVREVCGGVTCHQYGAGETQSLDLHVPEGADGVAPPLLVFFHGGYWQELSKQDSFFPGFDCAQNGIAYAAIDYTLAPHADLDQIVTECRDALAWLKENSSFLGFDADRIFLAGSSAGAHLAAMVAMSPPARTNLAGVILVSGIYELEPLIGTSINDAVGLDVETARRNSPLLLPLKDFPPALVCWGEIETDEFKRQSAAFAEELIAAGTNASAFEVVSKNHFDIILDLARPTTRLGRVVIDFIHNGQIDHADL